MGRYKRNSRNTPSDRLARSIRGLISLYRRLGTALAEGGYTEQGEGDRIIPIDSHGMRVLPNKVIDCKTFKHLS